MIWRNFLLVRDNFSFSTLCIQYCHRGHRFWAKLSSNQNFTKELYCKLIWRKKNLRDSELLVFRTLWKLQNFTATIFSQKFRQINVLLNNFTIIWFDGKKFAWQWISRLSTRCVFAPQSRNFCDFTWNHRFHGSS